MKGIVEAPEFAKAGQKPPEAIASTCDVGERIFFIFGTVALPEECDTCERKSSCRYWTKPEGDNSK